MEFHYGLRAILPLAKYKRDEMIAYIVAYAETQFHSEIIKKPLNYCSNLLFRDIIVANSNDVECSPIYRV